VEVERLLELCLEPVLGREQTAATSSGGKGRGALGLARQLVEIFESAIRLVVASQPYVRLGQLRQPRDHGRLPEPVLGGLACERFQPTERLLEAPEAELEQAEARSRQRDDRRDAGRGDLQRPLCVDTALLLTALRRLDPYQAAEAEGQRRDLVGLVRDPYGLAHARVGGRPVAGAEVQVGEHRERVGKCAQSASRAGAVDRPHEHLAGTVELLEPDQQLAVGAERLIEAHPVRRLDRREQAQVVSEQGYGLRGIAAQHERNPQRRLRQGLRDPAGWRSQLTRPLRRLEPGGDLCRHEAGPGGVGQHPGRSRGVELLHLLGLVDEKPVRGAR
jgi:hypothetical protein